MLLWLKADAGVYTNGSGGAAKDGNAVVQWIDQSGNSNNAYQSSTNNSAFFKTNVINGKPALAFYSSSGTNSYLTNNTLPTPTSMTVFWVGELNNCVFSPNFASYYDHGSSSAYIQGFDANPANGLNGQIVLETPINSQSFNATSMVGWLYVTEIFNGASSSVRINGILISDFSGSIPALTTTNGYNLGSVLDISGSSNYYIPEYIEYTGVQTSNVISQVEGYETNKYGL
jgi:hypothetical protein